MAGEDAVLVADGGEVGTLVPFLEEGEVGGEFFAKFRWERIGAGIYEELVETGSGVGGHAGILREAPDVFPLAPARTEHPEHTGKRFERDEGMVPPWRRRKARVFKRTWPLLYKTGWRDGFAARRGGGNFLKFGNARRRWVPWRKSDHGSRSAVFVTLSDGRDVVACEARMASRAQRPGGSGEKLA